MLCLCIMRTTIDLSKALYGRAKKLARERGVTLRALVEEGLRLVIEADADRSFHLADQSWEPPPGAPRGLARAGDLDWERIRDAVYEGRGV